MAHRMRYALGKVLCADRNLFHAADALSDDRNALSVILFNERLRKENQAFFDKMRERYNLGSKSFYYRFSGNEAQRAYDLQWHRLGYLIKSYLANRAEIAA